jgi:DnaJ-class molecular chaperone
MRLDLGEVSGPPSSEVLTLEHCARCQGLWLTWDDFHRARLSVGGEGLGKTRIEHVLARFDQAKQARDRSPQERKSSLVLASVLTLFVCLAAGLYYAGRKVQLNPYAPPVVADQCKICGGKGKVLNVCAVCNGTGQSVWARAPGDSGKITCPDCTGTGQVKTHDRIACSQCRGSGFQYVPDQDCRSCNGTGRALVVEKKTCEVCFGSGQKSIRQTCPVCNGTGRSQANPQWTCPTCSGAKTVEVKKTCPHCQGGTVEIRQSRQCAICSGKGRVAAEKKICDVCTGSGQVESGRSGACARCKGTGRVEPSTDGKCLTCNGKGNFGEINCSACKGTGKTS